MMEVLRQIGAELEADPQVGGFMLEPIDIWGVDALADTGVLIKARIKTRPLKQFYVKRQFNRLMKRRFDGLGIDIPSRPCRRSTSRPIRRRSMSRNWAARPSRSGRARRPRQIRQAARGPGGHDAPPRTRASRAVLSMARPSTLRRQLHEASRSARRILDFGVERVLALLKDDNLATRAALGLDAKDGILLECNFVSEVWADPRVAARIRQLGERGVTIEPVTYAVQGAVQAVLALADPRALLIPQAARRRDLPTALIEILTASYTIQTKSHPSQPRTPAGPERRDPGSAPAREARLPPRRRYSHHRMDLCEHRQRRLVDAWLASTSGARERRPAGQAPPWIHPTQQNEPD